MQRTLKTIAAALAAIFVLAGSSAAQLEEGDLLLADAQGDLLCVTWPNGTLRTLVPGLGATGMTPLPGNDAVACLLTDGRVVAVDARGAVRPIAQIPATGGGPIVLDQDRALLAASQSERSIFRITGAMATTFYSQPGLTPIHGLDRHGDTGNFVFVDDSTGFFGLDRVTGQRSFLGGGIEFTPNAILFVKSVGEIWIDYPSASTILRAGANGNFLGSLPFGGYYLASDEKRDRVFGAAAPQGLVAGVVEIDSSGQLVAERSYGGRRFRGVAVWGARNVAFDSSGLRGTVAVVDVSFRGSPNRHYCAALSLANRPGIPFGSQLLNLGRGELYAATLCGREPIGTGFAGVTDANGRATVSFAIPPNLSVPLSVHAGAVVADPRRPGGHAVSNVEVLLLR